ncbi:hypothetical protein N5D13_09935 [Stenotrophomonas maltophilia]|uniref:hypothetical protein n=1 Tax=Stenotrophomonas maltophilia TaxID=40324 RepID=UPI00244C2479|nr:hypothetical protein [Stenotrophomonas maltophilia]MDH0105709.1 hypothetical protein [Stenotrophomonas maltophilia]MDH0331888.1 hypothetical protein [Stenotrophomonas maltophilia]MDH0633593.1 hypothetical protein [Stenotrophomonas maltophilia]MDH0642930.1 hypothetical protein [Stenotrophomonas maltophilia]MDH0652627.1 hypothetical protein [Stenotrophomonas maltophilia]
MGDERRKTGQLFTWLIDRGVAKAEAMEKADEAVSLLKKFGLTSRAPTNDYFLSIERIVLVDGVTLGAEGSFKGEQSDDVILEILVGRTILRSDKEYLRSLSCPCCHFQHGLDTAGWEAALEQWYVDGGEGCLLCTQCEVATCISRWSFNDGAWALGNLAIGIVEGALTDDQQAQLLEFLGKDSARMSG